MEKEECVAHIINEWFEFVTMIAEYPGILTLVTISAILAVEVIPVLFQITDNTESEKNCACPYRAEWSHHACDQKD